MANPVAKAKMRILSGRRRRLATRGFTLVELLVVLTIVALAASLVAPPLGRALGVGQLRSETGDIVTALREARSDAILRGMPVDFVAVGPSRWRLAGRQHDLPAGISYSMSVPPAGHGAAGTTFIRFFPDGRSTGGSVIVRNDRSRRVITVRWLTGHVHAD